MAQLIVERATLINHLLPQDELRTELAEHVLTAMINMFYVYLMKAQLPQIEAAFQWVCTHPHILLLIHCCEFVTSCVVFDSINEVSLCRFLYANSGQVFIFSFIAFIKCF